MKVKFFYIDKTHTTICEIKCHDKTYTGQAICAPLDYDQESPDIGRQLAYVRAMIKKIRVDREMLIYELKSLRHVYNILEQNSAVSKKSIECYTLRRQIKLKERDFKNLYRRIQNFQKVELRLRARINYENTIQDNRDNC